MLIKNFLTGLFLLLTLSSFAQFTLRVEILNWPEKHSTDTFFIAGNFNAWNPGGRDHFFVAEGNKRIIQIKGLAADHYEFKVTRGNWSKTETDASGSDVFNKHVVLKSDTTIRITIGGWKDDFTAKPVVSTASKNVFVIDTAFYIPQLNRKRRIWIYLPAGYKTATQSYPVLYMHDGQNIFDASTGFAGEWGVDECLDTLKKKCIVVGIDHGGNKRLVEYNPYNTNLFGKGEGKLYVEFLVKTLKPFIDSHYRTRKESKYTFIAGSSMGGIISYYAALKYPGVFSAAGVFSPAFHISKKDFLDEVNADNKKIPARMFFVCGEAESASMVPDMKEIATLTLNKHAVKEIVFSVPEARHTESFWQQQLPAFLKWLLN